MSDSDVDEQVAVRPQMSWADYEELQREAPAEAVAALAAGEVDFESSKIGRLVARSIAANRAAQAHSLLPDSYGTGDMPGPPAAGQDYNEWVAEQRAAGGDDAA